MPEFVSLETFLRPPCEPPPSAGLAPEGLEDCDAFGEDGLDEDVLDETLAAVRRFRAALAEALDAAVATMLREIAFGVVARELALAPVDVAAIVDDARRRFAIDELVRVRVHPDEIGALAALDLTVMADPRLRRGDVEIDLGDGTIDATLGARLARVLPA